MATEQIPADRTMEDEDGFLRQISTWTREKAEELAVKNDIGPLTEDHWRIIEFVNDYFLHKREGPPIVRICKELRLSRKYVCDLFPCGIARGAYRLAGLPRPSGCL